MKKLNLLITVLLAACPLVGFSKQNVSVVSINVVKKGAEIPAGLWGIFYEEICHVDLCILDNNYI